MKISNRRLQARQTGKDSEKASEILQKAHPSKLRSSESTDTPQDDIFQRKETLSSFGKLLNPTDRRTRTNSIPSNSVAVVRDFLENPSPSKEAQFRTSFNELFQVGQGGNIQEIIFSVMKESISEMNEDKKYFLEKLQMYNSMGKQLSDYLNDLIETGQNIGTREADDLIEAGRNIGIRKAERKDPD